MFRFFFCSAVITAFSMIQAEEKTYGDTKPYYRTTIRHTESGGIGYERGYTTFEAFFAADSSHSLIPFLDAKGHVFNNQKCAGNIGMGLRTQWKNRIYGINTYYDYRDTGHLHSNQVGVGFETLGELFDFRINGYLPVGTKSSHFYDTAFAGFSGNQMHLSQKYQSAMKGADAECGFHFGKSKSFDFYAAVGPYYFTGRRDPSTWGGKARITGSFEDILALEISSSYDRTFRYNFQAQIALNFSFSPESNIKKQPQTQQMADILSARMLQPVGRQEIIAVDNSIKHSVATDPTTGLPLSFVFVDNTSHSEGTYESPFHSLAQAEDNSSAGDIIYVFPGDGTTTGMDAGIYLKENQKFWGSGVDYTIPTSLGMISLPAQSSTSPTITSTDVDRGGDAITLASHNAISGFVITAPLNDAIYGNNSQSLEVSSCTIENTRAFAIEASFSGEGSIVLTNNQFLNNTNGVLLTLNGASTLSCLENTFSDQTSISSVPLAIDARNNSFTADIENNTFDSNRTGSVRFNIEDVDQADIIVANNAFTHNETGSQATLGSNLVILPSGTTTHCSLALINNTFSDNTGNALYLHTSGAFTTLEATVSKNTVSNSGGAALVFATPLDHLTLVATDNTIVGANDNGIAVLAAGSSSNGHIAINNNTITDIGSGSNGIAINQDFTELSLTLLNNEISRCQGSGIITYAQSGIDNLTLTISGNAISDCENLTSNSASGLCIQQYQNVDGSIANNTLSDNAGVDLFIGSVLTSPTVSLTLNGNSAAHYLLTNPEDGTFNLSPSDVESVNTGEISTSGVITISSTP